MQPSSLQELDKADLSQQDKYTDTLHSKWRHLVLAQIKVLWYRRFRAAAYVSSVGLMLLTFIIVLPFHPFSYLPPIIVSGGPGIWLLLGYVLYAIVGFGGFASLSALLFVVETHEGRRPDSRMMTAGFALLFAGVTLSCVLLVLAGALGGYASTIKGASTQAVEAMLNPYVYPTTVTALASVIGAGLLIVGMTGAKARTIE